MGYCLGGKRMPSDHLNENEFIIERWDGLSKTYDDKQLKNFQPL
jgi:hypothetical protein